MQNSKYDKVSFTRRKKHRTQLGTGELLQTLEITKKDKKDEETQLTINELGRLREEAEKAIWISVL